jgi:hypothetical protein
MAPVFEGRSGLHIAFGQESANVVLERTGAWKERYAADGMGSYPSAAQRNEPLK